MRVGVIAAVFESISGTLVKTHRVWKRRFEKPVIHRGQVFQKHREIVTLAFTELVETGCVSFPNHQSFKGPNSPERNDGDEVSFYANHANFFLQLQLQVVAEQTRRVCLVVSKKRINFFESFVRNMTAGPNLSVRMRIARTHHCSSILKDLN